MELIELATIAFLLAAAWLWLDSLKTREIALQAAALACHDEGLQILDDTVACRSLRLARDDAGQLRLRRVYAFEYSETGDNRREGSVALLGHQVELLHLRPHLYVVPKTPDSHETLH